MTIITSRWQRGHWMEWPRPLTQAHSLWTFSRLVSVRIFLVASRRDTCSSAALDFSQVCSRLFCEVQAHGSRLEDSSDRDAGRSVQYRPKQFGMFSVGLDGRVEQSILILRRFFVETRQSSTLVHGTSFDRSRNEERIAFQTKGPGNHSKLRGSGLCR
jgi:hypothetical protein